jgi:Peroxisomal biogenesis factor 11 (PEX11)
MYAKQEPLSIIVSTTKQSYGSENPVLKPSLSMEVDLKEKINKIVLSSNSYLKRILWVVSEFVTNLLRTSKGRNNFCQLIQYQAQLFYECQVNSNIPEIQEMIMHLGKPKKILLSGRIYSTMSKHRKIFNLFKFIDELTRIQKVVGDKRLPTYMKILTSLSHGGSFLYYMLDNFLWLIYSNICSTPFLI